MLSAETTSLPTGDVMKLETSFAPVDTSDQVVKYTSSDPDVATVDEFGTITGVSVGSARIMAETREGLSDDLEIAVVENPYTLIPQSNMTATATSVYGGRRRAPPPMSSMETSAQYGIPTMLPKMNCRRVSPFPLTSPIPSAASSIPHVKTGQMA